ncbi:MAG: diaminopimelate epimerase [Prevotella sp.]|nr:diaminopimelate epimerase [Prevotella sp.]
MSKIKFTKMHGAGNDYIYVDTMQYPISDPSALSIQWSDRHQGIGSDGLVLIGASTVPEADFSMRIFNADGSEAMMCGNASRCIGKYLYERGLTSKTSIRLLTLSGIKTLLLHVSNGIVDSVTVDMLEPTLEDDRLYQPTVGLDEGTFVSMGNPHYVIFTDDVDIVEKKGRILEHHLAFPERCNIEFAKVLTDGSIRTRVWERGSGITCACGTGACATAIAAALTGRAGRQSDIVMDGGTLHIEWNEQDRHVYMTGPAAFVFDGEIDTNN